MLRRGNHRRQPATFPGVHQEEDDIVVGDHRLQPPHVRLHRPNGGRHDRMAGHGNAHLNAGRLHAGADQAEGLGRRHRLPLQLVVVSTLWKAIGESVQRLADWIGVGKGSAVHEGNPRDAPGHQRAGNVAAQSAGPK